MPPYNKNHQITKQPTNVPKITAIRKTTITNLECIFINLLNTGTASTSAKSFSPQHVMSK